MCTYIYICGGSGPSSVYNKINIEETPATASAADDEFPRVHEPRQTKKKHKCVM
jgi:hypothetical protein